MDQKLPPLASKQLEEMLVPIDILKPHPENYKEHPEEQRQVLNASLQAFGWTIPICCNPQNVIVRGHGMYMTALEKGYTHVPVEYVALDDKQSKAYLIADNETNRKAVTNHGKMVDILSDLSEYDDFDMLATGFSPEEVDVFLNTDTDFSFGDFCEEDDEGEPYDIADVEGEATNKAFVIHISFKTPEKAELFLINIGAKQQNFAPGKTSTIVNGEELEF
jgi:hypothetical protein